MLSRLRLLKRMSLRRRKRRFHPQWLMFPWKDLNQDEIAQAKERQSIILQKLRQDVIESTEQSSMLLRDNPDRAIELLRASLDTVKASGLSPDQIAPLVEPARI